MVKTNAEPSETNYFFLFKKAKDEHEKLLHDYGERVKELNCIYKFSKFVETPNIPLQEILQKTNELLPGAWQYPEVACSRIILGKQEFSMKNFKPTKWRQQSPIKVRGRKRGFVEVCYLEEKPTLAEGPFLVEERFLLDAIAERLGRIIERKTAENTLKKNENKLRLLLEKMQRRESDFAALLKASGAVLENKEFDISARAIFNECKQLIGATAGYVALLSDTGKDNIVLFLESGGFPCSVDPTLPMPIRGLRAETYRKGKAAVENEFPKSKYKKYMPKGHVHLKNVLFAPLTVDNKTVGTIGLANKPGGFSQHDARLALAFGKIASIALINSKMLEVLEDNEKRLRSYSENLEKLIEERTQQLKDSERLAAIGATAGMVGHDIRNPLQAIISDIYLTKTDLDSIPESEEKRNIRESLMEIEKNLLYINKIISDLQDFARPLYPKLEEISFEQTIYSVLANINIPGNVTVKCSICEDFPKLKTDESYLQRIMTNLVNNGIQAMPNGGNLTITASTKNGRSIIRVEDTGEGIPENVRNKLFTPLVTTKSKGQGFGLSVVKRFTEALGGVVRFESENGKGTKFIIELPL